MQLIIQTIICMVKHPTRVSGLLLLDGLQRPCGSWMHYAMRDVKDMGQQMGYRSLEWNWPKEAMTDLFGLVLLMEPSCFNLLFKSSLVNS